MDNRQYLDLIINSGLWTKKCVLSENQGNGHGTDAELLLDLCCETRIAWTVSRQTLQQ